MGQSDHTTVEFVVVDFSELRHRPTSNGVGWRARDGDIHTEYNDVITEMYVPRVLKAVDPDEHPAGTVIARITFYDPDNPADSMLEWEPPFRDHQHES